MPTLGNIRNLTTKWTVLLDEWLGSFLLHLLATQMRSQGRGKHVTGVSVNTFSNVIGRPVYTAFILKPNHILYLKALLWGHIEEIYVIQSASWDSYAGRFSLLLEANKLPGTKQKHAVFLPIRRWPISHTETCQFPSCTYDQDIWDQVISPSVRKSRAERRSEVFKEL